MENEQKHFDLLVEHVRRARGLDVDGYKRAGLMRRIKRRMQMVGIDSFMAYMDHLEVHPEEYGRLFDALLINVTSFFRDPPVWEYVRDHVAPALLEARGPRQQIRVWSAGCSSGMEPYTIAMILAEAMGAEAFRERVKIYATDIDEAALAEGRLATYDAREAEAVPPELFKKYFEAHDGRVVFSKELRRAVIFGRHDLMADAPISRVDLLSCRNALMYFNAEAQARILSRFHFALADDAFLVLGRAETLLTHSTLFTPMDLRRRVFRKVPKPNVRDRLLTLASGGGAVPPELMAGGDGEVGRHRLHELAFDAGPVAQIVVAADGTLAAANDRARALFHLTPRDLGRPLQDLELSYRPAELRSLIEQAHAERRPVLAKEVRWISAGGERAHLDVEVASIGDGAGGVAGTSIVYADVTRHRRLQDELQQSHQELEAAYEELQSTSEELETTNEELQSTVEELETTNEELQSTNEELETMNEELQSANEELHSINDMLRQRSEELSYVNGFFGAFLASLPGGVVVVDRELNIHAWNERAEDLWGLRQEEVSGRHFASLDIGLPVHRLLPVVRACAAGESADGELVLDAVNRRGRAIQCHVTCRPLKQGNDGTRGVILLMTEVEIGHGVTQ